MYHIENDSTGVRTMPAYHDGEGVMRTRGFFDEVSRLPIKFQMWELDPGVSEGGHVHEGDDALEEVYYFLSGRGTMWADGEDFAVTAGDAVMVPPGSDHGFRNTGSEPLKLVIIWGKPAA
jgi:mannose-6-phosphate isomerase-like protein (cupin superfamily)